MNVAGSDQRQDDLFSTDSLLAIGRSALKGLKGVENVYMQHTPHLSQTLENLFKGKLRETSYPFLEGAGVNAGLQRPQDVIIFMIGGATYEEARTIALMNQESSAGSTTTASTTPAGVRLLLGGTCIHNASRSVFGSTPHHRSPQAPQPELISPSQLCRNDEKCSYPVPLDSLRPSTRICV